MHLETYGISLAKAEKAAGNVRTLVIIEAPRPSIATAPRGRGCVMMPTMVPRKMASRCHACSATPAGGGTNQTMVAMLTQMPRFFMSAPHLNGGSLGAAGVELSAPVELAATCKLSSFSERRLRTFLLAASPHLSGFTTALHR